MIPPPVKVRMLMRVRILTGVVMYHMTLPFVICGCGYGCGQVYYSHIEKHRKKHNENTTKTQGENGARHEALAKRKTNHQKRHRAEHKVNTRLNQNDEAKHK